MRRVCLFCMLMLSLFFLVGCGSSTKENTGVFLFSSDDFKKAESFTQSYDDDVFALKYPKNWKKETPIMGAKFIIMKEDYKYAPNTSMNVVERKSDPRFVAAPIELIKKEFPKALLNMGITNVQFIQIKRDTWQDKPGMQMEYIGDFKGDRMHYMQYFRDNGSKIAVITFTIDEREWQETVNEVKGIAASVYFKD